MSTPRQHIIDQLAADRFLASQASIEAAAMNGELGVETQLVAMGQLYTELRAAGKLTEAAAVKAEAYRIYEGRAS